MSFLTDRIDHHNFAPLPRPSDAKGARRRVGIELEFGGLDEHAAGDCVRDCLGGTLEKLSAHEWQLHDTAIGSVEVYLDTAFRDRTGSGIGRLGLDLGRLVIPVEIVTAPLTPDKLPLIDDLRAALRALGATGTRDGMFLGYGVHFNPAIAGETVHDILPVVRAYALIEDWLRYADPISPTRRLLPFAAPYPRRFVDDLARDAPNWSLDAFWCIYLHYNTTRNRGLDLLPIIGHLNPGRIACLRDRTGKVKPRPAFHYRLPDSRVDEAAWSLAYEWNRWVTVERLAEDTQLCARLAMDWQEYRSKLTTTRRDWRSHVEDFLCRHALTEADGCLVR